MRRLLKSTLLAVLLFTFTFGNANALLFGQISYAADLTAAQTSTINDLNTKINEHNATIKQLEADIANYTNQANQANKTAQSLQGALNELTLTQKKLTSSISLTEAQIEQTNLTLDQLTLKITEKEKQIGDSGDAISKALKQLYQSDSEPLIETLLSYKTTSDFWDNIEQTAQFRDAIGTHLTDLKQLQKDLQDEKDQTTSEKNKLVTLESTLGDQKKIVDSNSKQKNQLLTQTKAQESSYKKLVAQKQALRDQFQQELTQFESQLKLAIDPSSIPKAGTSPLSWPVDNPYITQYFGNTDFAKAFPQLYGGIGHNGIDLRAAIGTPIKSAADGVVIGTGNTDLVCAGASYGQWVFIQHNNGLSTLYGHLSLIKAVKGQKVSTGDIIGYSGQTGYATGPHLHFTVYATQGVQIMSRPSAVCKGTYVMPLADLKAYLNPLAYLPPYNQ